MYESYVSCAGLTELKTDSCIGEDEIFRKQFFGVKVRLFYTGLFVILKMQNHSLPQGKKQTRQVKDIDEKKLSGGNDRNYSGRPRILPGHM